MQRTPFLSFLAALVIVVGAAASLSGCASSDSMSSSAVVPVTDVKSVVGKWAGLAEGPGSNQTDYVELTIRADGTYDVMTRRQMGTFSGKGQIVLNQGQLVMKGSGGTGVATLVTRGSERILKIDAVFQSNIKVSADLRPTL
jgi:outer membrane lipoprotein SlyB